MERLKAAPAGIHPMMLMLAKGLGLGIETAVCWCTKCWRGSGDLFDTVRPNSEWPALLRSQARTVLEALLTEAIGVARRRRNHRARGAMLSRLYAAGRKRLNFPVAEKAANDQISGRRLQHKA